MPAHDRPRERLYYQGPAALKEEELVAIILRTGMQGRPVLELSRELLRHYGGLGGLARVGATELKSFKGLGMAKAVELQTALEVGRRLGGPPPGGRAPGGPPGGPGDVLVSGGVVLG